MSRPFATVLGFAAFLTVVTRQLVEPGDLETTLLTAFAAAFGFATLGGLIGMIAQRMLFTSLRTHLHHRPKGTSGRK